MLDRESCERRVYRLATLLCGDSVSAAGVIRDVLSSRPDVRDLDGPHMDRLTILRTREITPGTIADESLNPRIAAALGGLPQQQREAWVLVRVYQTPLRDTARAMDCSVTATTRHLDLALAVMGRLASPPAPPPDEAVRKYSSACDLPHFYRAAQRRRTRLRHVTMAIVILGLVLAALTAAAFWLAR